MDAEDYLDGFYDSLALFNSTAIAVMVRRMVAHKLLTKEDLHAIHLSLRAAVQAGERVPEEFPVLGVLDSLVAILPPLP